MKTLLVILLTINTINNACMKHIEKTSIGAYLFDDNNHFLPFSHFLQKTNSEDTIHLEVITDFIPEEDPFKSSKAFCNRIEKIPNLVAVFASESSWATPIVQSICSKLNVPYIQTNWRQPLSYIGSPTSLNFYPDFDVLALGLAKLLGSLEWNSFIVLYEDFEGFTRIQEILKLQRFQDKTRNNIIVKKLTFRKNNKYIFKEIKHSKEHHIIIDCHVSRIMQVLEQAKSFGLTSFMYQYFLTSLDAHTVDFSNFTVEANITTVRMMNPESSNFKSIVASWEESVAEKVNPYHVTTEMMLVHESINLVIEAFKNIIEEEDTVKFNNISCTSVEKFYYGPDIISYIKSHYQFSTFPFTETGRRTKFHLELIERKSNEVLTLWDSNYPETVNVIRTIEETTKKRQESLQAGVNIIASRIEKPYLMYKENAKLYTGNDMYEGYVMDLITQISLLMNNFTFEFRVVKDNHNGEYNPTNETWDGIIGEVVNERALFGVGDLTITSERETAVDFSMPYMRLGIGILLQKPKTNVDIFAFLNPLSVEVWMYTLTLYLTVSIILYFVARMAPGDWENPHPCNLNPTELENLWTISNCLWLTMGSIMNQGSDILPKGISSRLVTSMWWFFALIMTNSYIASLAAFLTVTANIIDDLEDLAKQNKIKYGTLESGSTRDFFRVSNYSTYRRMYANMRLSKPSVFVPNTEDGVNRVSATKDGLYAFLMESSTIEYTIERRCNLTTVENKYFKNLEYGIAMPLDCPFRSDINDAILKLQEQGVLTDLKNKWWREKYRGPQCPAKNEATGLSLENVGGIFMVLGIGVAIALFLGIIEFLWTVRQTSIEERITYWEAFKMELLFSLKVWISQKKVKSQNLQSPNMPVSKRDDESPAWPQ